MKNSLYIIAALLVVIWAIVYFADNSSGMIHLLLVVAGFVLIIRIFTPKKLSNRW